MYTCMFGIEFLLNEENYARNINLRFLYDCGHDKINLHCNIFLDNVRETPIVIHFFKMFFLLVCLLATLLKKLGIDVMKFYGSAGVVKGTSIKF